MTGKLWVPGSMRKFSPRSSLHLCYHHSHFPRHTSKRWGCTDRCRIQTDAPHTSRSYSCSHLERNDKRFSIIVIHQLPWEGHFAPKKDRLLPCLFKALFSVREVAALATFKKDTILERQGRFTLSTLQGGARAGERE